MVSILPQSIRMDLMKTLPVNSNSSPYLEPNFIVKIGLVTLSNLLMIGLFSLMKTEYRGLEFLRWLGISIGLFSILVAVLIPVIRISRTSGLSMMPTIKDRGLCLGESLSLYLKIPLKRGDIVCFTNSLFEKDSKRILKRIVAVPGDSLQIRDGRLYVNHKLVEKPWTAENKFEYDILIEQDIGEIPENELRIGDPIVVPKDHYFVLGDNPGVSQHMSWDSRMFGYLPKENIYQRIVYVFPFT